ncbi:LicD family protein [Lactobacillus delbrueckii subsp. bulgaricus]
MIKRDICKGVFMYLTLKEVQQVETDLLVKISEFCDKHDLVYTLAGGTMLGAIRHQDTVNSFV